MKLLTKEQQESYENANICYIYSENIKDNHIKNKILSSYGSFSLYRKI